MRARLRLGSASLDAEIADRACARAIAEALRIEARAERWGDEFYFEIPVARALDEAATTKVRVGELGDWPPGKALRHFLGPTPDSRGPDPVPASDVHLVGRVLGDATAMRSVRGEPRVRVERA